jgi:hypothetical protein
MSKTKLPINKFLIVLINLDPPFTIQNCDTNEIYSASQLEDHFSHNLAKDYRILRKGTKGITRFCMNEFNRSVTYEGLPDWFPIVDFGFTKSKFMELIETKLPEFFL